MYKLFEVDVSVIYFEMEKLKNRAVIEYLFKKGLSPQEIHNDMVNVLGESAPSYATVKNWVAEFKRGRTSIEDDPRSGRPKTATTSEIIEQIHAIVGEDSSAATREIADTIGISDERVLHILHVELHMRKLFRKLVSHSLTIQQKLNRKQICQRNLELFKVNTTDFFRRFITMGETWIYHHDPKLKQEQLQWTEAGCSAPKQVKHTRSARKVMALVFWDAKGILLIDYLEKGKTINSEYYCNLLDQLDEKIREKRPGLQKKKIIYH